MEVEASKKERVDELRRRLGAIGGAGHGPECQKIVDELMSLHPRVELTPGEKEAHIEQNLKRFLRTSPVRKESQ
jgi:hypothetical protein